MDQSGERLLSLFQAFRAEHSKTEVEPAFDQEDNCHLLLRPTQDDGGGDQEIVGYNTDNVLSASILDATIAASAVPARGETSCMLFAGILRTLTCLHSTNQVATRCDDSTLLSSQGS